ncbi:MAG TPA: amino acid ABC transporter permease [Acetobacteraceae bacterium]|nr:amino acid ABC transporter permease [Acetobacteraceae bacterium]
MAAHAMTYHFSFGFILDYWSALLVGLATTLKLTVVCVVLGMLLGFALSLMRMSENRLIYAIGSLYVEFFRGTPVLIQIFWIFFCLPLVLHVEIGSLASAIIALSLYMGAISCETFRAAMKAIAREQHDACVALGLAPLAKITHVVFPQTILRAIPTLLSNTVSLFKESSLVSAVGMSDLLYVGQNIATRTFHPVEILTTVAFIYFVIAFPLTRAVTIVEQRLLRKIEA